MRLQHQHSGLTYRNISFEIRQHIRNECLLEQHYLCAYCCKAVDQSSSHNDHLIPQSQNASKSLDFNNIVASCETPAQCGKFRGARSLPLTPLMAACEEELRFYISGKVKGLTERARLTVTVLNLGDTRRNNRRLIETRKQLIGALIYQYGSGPHDIELLDAELLEGLIGELQKPVAGRLEAYAPALVNVLRNIKYSLFKEMKSI